MAVKIQFRRGTSSEWTTQNPVLLAGEMGLDTTANAFKLGDGVKTWTQLAFVEAGPPGEVAHLPALVDGKGTKLRSPNEAELAVDAKRFAFGTFLGVNNTVTETSLTGGGLSVSPVEFDCFEFRVGFVMTNNTAADRTLTLRFKVGGTTILTWDAVVPTSANPRQCSLNFTTHMVNFIGLRPISHGTLNISAPNGTGNDTIAVTRFNSSQTVTSPTTMELTGQLSTASANLNMSLGVASYERSWAN